MSQHSQKRHSAWTAPFRWISGELSRIRLTVWLLIVMGVTMIVGSIFPQGYDADTYVSSWGEETYAALSKWGLLNLFHTKYFLILGGILLLNLLFCSLVRWFGRSGAGLARERPAAHAREIALAGGHGESPRVQALSVLEARGYKILSSAGNVITARRGPWPEGVSLLYHIAMAIAIVGFILSALFSFEGDATLYPGEPQQIATVNAETGACRLGLVKADTTAWEDRYVTITLNEFITEWELDQKKEYERGLFNTKYEFLEHKYYPRDWMSELTGVDDDGNTRDALVEVNRPLRISGLTFYQMAYEQEFDVVVMKDTLEVERVRANAYEPFTLESIGGTFFPGTLRVGTLYQKYHDTEPVVPHTALKWQPPAPPDTAAVEPPTEGIAAHGEETGETHGEEGAPAEDETSPPPPPEKIEIGDLSAGEPIELEGYTLLLENPYEASVLTYRHDPGVPVLYIAIIAFMIGLAIRTYWPSYRVNLWIEDSPTGVRGRLAFRASGMLGEPEEIEKGLASALSGESQ